MAPSLATYVPRCYGKTDDEIFDTPVTEGEVQLMVARRECFTSWDALTEGTSDVEPGRDEAWRSAPFGAALVAITAGDLDSVKSIVTANPELLRPSAPGRVSTAAAPFAKGPTITSNALMNEISTRSESARAITEWLVSMGGDLQTPLNERLIGHMHATADEFEYVIARGADPTWVPKNGVSRIEHVMLRCWNPGPVDILARYVTPRKTFWITAGVTSESRLPTVRPPSAWH